MKLLLLLSIVAVASSNIHHNNNALFERYSKMRLLSTCLGEITIARWRQQLITASKKCEQNPPFIPALLHQYPSVTFEHHQQQQQKKPPHFFVPNIPPQMQHHYQQQRPQQHHFVFPAHVQQQIQQKLQQQIPYQPLVLAPSHHHHHQAQQTLLFYKQPTMVYRQSHQPVAYTLGQFYVSPAPSKTHTAVYNKKKPVLSNDDSSEEEKDIVIQGPTSSQQQEKPSDPQSLDRIVGTKPLAGQKESYTDPSLQYEETEQYFQEQEAKRSFQPIPIPVMQHRVPMIPTAHQHPAAPSRIQKREANPGWYNGNNNRGSDPPKSEKLRTLLRSRVSDRISNMTCVMKSLGMLDENLGPNLRFLEESLLELPIPNELYEDLRAGIDHCQSISSCRSSDRPVLHDMPVNTAFSESLEFFQCFGKQRLRSCMKSNIEGMMQLMEREQIVDPISGFYEPESQVSSAVGELEDLLTGTTGSFVDMLLL